MDTSISYIYLVATFTSVIASCLSCFALGFFVGKYYTENKKTNSDNVEIPIENAIQNKSTIRSIQSKLSNPIPAASIAKSVGKTAIAPVSEKLSNASKSSGKSEVVTIAQAVPDEDESSDYYFTNEYNPTIDKARSTIHTLVGFKGSTDYLDSKRTWETVQSSASSHFWLSKSKKDGILLRGAAYASSSPLSILKWLIEKDLVSGIEGLSHTTETLSKFNNEAGYSVMIRKMICKSGSIMSSNRDFHLITSISNEEDGSYLLATRSIPEDFNNKQKNSTKGMIRAIVYASGYILRPWKFQDKEACEISYVAHLDLLGSRGRMNAVKTDGLVIAVVSMIQSIQSGVTEERNYSSSNSIPIFKAIKNGTRYASETQLKEPDSDDEYDAIPEYLILTADQRHDLLLKATSALDKLRILHARLDNSNQLSAKESAAEPGSHWEVFYASDNITIKELSLGSSPIGILSATCTINASPNVVRSLLLEHPDAVDCLLEGRGVLNKINRNCFVQWMAYGPMWPATARDFLLLTAEEDFDLPGSCAADGRSSIVGKVPSGAGSNTGFLLVSTSVDEIVNISSSELREKFLVSDASQDPTTTQSNYTRSSLRLAGYIGVSSAEGGTELTLIVDFDVDNGDIPCWLLQILAQYGLIEIMSRIRHAACGDIDASPSTVAQDGSYELSRILNNIQSREARKLKAQPNSSQYQNGSTSEQYDSDSPSVVKKRTSSFVDNILPNSNASPLRSRLMKTFSSTSANKSSERPSEAGYQNGGTQAGISGRQFRAISNASPMSLSINSSQVNKHPPQNIPSAAPPSPKLSIATSFNNQPSGPGRNQRSNSISAPNTYSGYKGPSTPTKTLTRPRTDSADGQDLVAGSGGGSSNNSSNESIPIHSNTNSNNYDSVHVANSVPQSPKVQNSKGPPTRESKELFEHNVNELQGIFSNNPRNSLKKSHSFVGSISSTPAMSPNGQKPHHRRQLSKIDYNNPNAMKSAMMVEDSLNKLKYYLGLENNAKLDLGLDWQQKVVKPNVTVYATMVNESSWQAIKAVSVIKANKQSILALLTDDSRMGEFDDMFDNHKYISKVDSHTHIRKLNFKAVWPTAPRDFLLCTTWNENPDGSILIATTSVSDELCPPEKGYVRGSIQISGYFIQPYESLSQTDLSCTNLSPNQCKITLVAHTELGGSLPASVINMLSTTAPIKILTSVNEILTKQMKS